MKLELSVLASDKAIRLRGFRIAGVFPLHLKYMRMRTHIDLCGIQAQIQALKSTEDKSTELDAFYNQQIQEALYPLICEYIAVALCNSRFFLVTFVKWFLLRRIKQCGYIHIYSLYSIIIKLDDPSFFLDVWTHLQRSENTLLREDAR